MITLTTPITPTVATVRTVKMELNGAPMGAAATATGSWAQCDPVAGAPWVMFTNPVSYTDADWDAFCAAWQASRAGGAAGNLQAAMDAALMSNQAGFVGTVST